MPGRYLRGALISYTQTVPLPIPNLILFQYNPDQLTHAWTPAVTATNRPDGTPPPNPLAITAAPAESFSFTLQMDANDSIADDGPLGEAIARLSGVASRIAALEMLLFPTDPAKGALIGSVSASISAGGASLSAGGGAQASGEVPKGQLPTVLFVWGPGRIVPVRVSTLSFTETLYDPVLLVPFHAQATVTLTVLNERQIEKADGPLAALAANAADYTHKVRQGLAIANLGNAVASVAGMLPI